jgi:lipopolysaccharide export system protein LptA
MTNRIHQLLLLWAITSGVMAAEPAKAPAPEAEKIKITSTEGFEYDLKEGTAVYTGNVIVDDPTMKMTCYRLSVKFAPKDGGKSADKSLPLVTGNFGGQVQSIEATGTVVILNKKDGSKATGDKAVYTTTNETIVLSGNRPTITAGSNGLKADRVIFDRVRGKFRAEGQIESFIAGASLFNASTRPPSLNLP